MSTDKNNVTPAAVLAAMQGDFKNAAIALMPGGIEAQEKAGQLELTTNSKLPIECTPETKTTLESWGVKFHEPIDDLFVSVTLPDGWKVIMTSHSMWSDLVDNEGKPRAEIFYKAAFYDKRANIHIRKEAA